MSKRTVKDPITKVDADLVRTPQASRGVGKNAKTQKYYKRNYLDVVKIVTPDVYWEDDIDLSGVEVAELDQLINGNILAANTSGLVYASSIAHVNYLSSIDTINGISKFFIKQNNLSWITPETFNRKILIPLKAGLADVGLTTGKVLTEFDTSGALHTYISGTLLPNIPLEQKDGIPGNNLASKTASSFDNTSSGTHKYLIDHLSWVYLLNRPDPAGATGQDGVRPATYSTSAEIAKVLTEKMWSAEVFGLEDSMKILQKHLWSNYPYFSGVDEAIIPKKYRLSGTGEFVSGTQLRDRLETLAQVVYSDDYFDNKDRKIQSSFEDYISTTALITDDEAAGPFTRFMKALGFSFAERSAEAQEIETLLDIDSCPDTYLPYLADLIGWVLLGADASRHRNQIRQAVAMYKAKGTKRSIQYVSDALFGTSAFNIVDNQLFDLWETYIPNLIYYSIATSSTLTENGIASFTRHDANRLGLDTYNANNLDENIRLAVDRILWELISEFPDNFLFAGKPYPRPKFYYADTPTLPGVVPYEGPWVRYPNGYYFTSPGPNEAGGFVGNEGQDPDVENWVLGNSFVIIPVQEDNFQFNYRGRTMPFPPWEEIKYYQDCVINKRFIKALENKLLCFGVHSSLVASLITYIKANSIEKTEIEYFTNSFLFFTESEKLAPNYDEIITVNSPEGNELIKYLPVWNSKSSHFKMKFSSSSFDFTSPDLDRDSAYALRKIKSIVNTAAPAHAIPEILLDLAEMEDVRLEVSANACSKVRLPLSSTVAPEISGTAASSTILANYETSAVRTDVVFPVSSLINKFKRTDADSLADPIFASGASGTYAVSSNTFFGSAPRNSLRRKNLKYLINHEELDLRDGIGSPAVNFLFPAAQVSAIYATGVSSTLAVSTAKINLAASGVLSLGFMPSSLAFKEVALKKEPFGFSNIIDYFNLHEVWDRCQNYSSSSRFFDVEVSNTYPTRGYVSPYSDDCSAFFSRREPLNDLLALMHRVSYEDKKLEASSMVSGYLKSDGSVDSTWPASSVKISPTTFSDWYQGGYRDVVTSIANQLEENDISSVNINYMEDFAFGRKLNTFYKQWLDNYGRVALNLNYKQRASYNPSLLSHTYGPYLFNSDFEHTGSSVALVPSLVASTVEGVNSVIDISYGFGNGVLAENNDYSLSTYAATNTSDMYVWRPEVRSDALLSGVEFVDTSGGQETVLSLPTLPTFALLKIANLNPEFPIGPNTPLWAYNRTLEDNLVIKYARNFENTLPRLRYKIEPNNNSREDLKNFLVPNCDYSINVKAANLNTDNITVGGSTLKAWIHTAPMDYTVKNADGTYTTESSVWSFSNNEWLRTPVSTITEYGGRFYVEWNSVGQKFPPGQVQTVETTTIEVGDSRSGVTNEIIVPYNLPPRIDCAEALQEEQQTAISDLMFENLEFSFNTNNKDIEDRPDDGLLHTNNRKYYIEIFLQEADKDSYIIFDTISMVNNTFKNQSIIQTQNGEYKLNRKELKTCFDHFNNMASNSLAARNQFISSGTMELSGGGRLNYRENINRNTPIFNTTAFFNQITGLTILG